jgi:hypothetical protein
LNIDGNTLIFVKQEGFNGPPGSNYANADAAFQDYETLYDGGLFDQGPGTTPSDPDYSVQSFDESRTVSGGEALNCTATDGASNTITYTNVSGSPKVYPGLPMIFSGTVFGGMTTGLYVVLTSTNDTTFTVGKASPATATEASTNLITITDITGFDVGDAVQFYQTTFGGLVEDTPYYILTKSVISGTTAQITVSLTPGGVTQTLSSGSGSCLMYGTTIDLSTDAGSMTATTYNERMAIYQINVDPETELVNLTLVDQTASNEYVQISRGTQYRSAQLYRPTIAGAGLTRISWLPLATEVTEETLFDGGSVEFIEPVDMYNPGDSNDKYLVFPKTNILI